MVYGNLDAVINKYNKRLRSLKKEKSNDNKSRNIPRPGRFLGSIG